MKKTILFLITILTTSLSLGQVTGTGTANTISKWTGTGIQGDSQLFDNGIGVGIGTSTPKGKFNVFTGLSALTVDMVNQENGSISFSNGNTSTATPTIVGKSNNNYGLRLLAGANDVNGSPDLLFQVMENDGTDFATLTTPAFRFSRFSTSLFEIGRNGNVGIGTTTPSVAKLSVLHNESTVFQLRNSVATGQSLMTYYNEGATASLVCGINNSAYVASSDFGEAGDAFIRSGAGSDNLNIINSSTKGGGISLRTNNGGVANERMKVLANGDILMNAVNNKGKLNVGVGTAASFDLAGQDDGSISFANAGGASPIIVSKSSTNLFRIISGTSDTNSNPDMILDVRQINNDDFTTLTSPAFRFTRGGATRLMEIMRNGNVGMGTTSAPVAKLQVVDTNGGFLFDGTNATYNRFKSTAVSSNVGKDLLFSAQSAGTTPDLYIDSTLGNVGIGTTNPTSKLTVAGNINSREVKVTVDAGADFVFENNYNLPSLEAVDRYIKENKHLPEIASADEMKKEGINLSEMNIKLLQKIEELTLYIIQQERKNDQQSLEIELLKKEKESFRNILERLSLIEEKLK